MTTTPTTAQLMLTTGEWGPPIDVPLPEGWEYSARLSSNGEGYIFRRDAWGLKLEKTWFGEDRARHLCDAFAVRALAKRWTCVPWASKDGAVHWHCVRHTDHWRESSLPAAVIAEFGGGG